MTGADDPARPDTPVREFLAYRRLGAPNRASAVLTWASTEGQDD